MSMRTVTSTDPPRGNFGSQRVYYVKTLTLEKDSRLLGCRCAPHQPASNITRTDNVDVNLHTTCPCLFPSLSHVSNSYFIDRSVAARKRFNIRIRQPPQLSLSTCNHSTMLLFWLILTGVVGFLLGIALVLAIQRNVLAPPSEPNKLLPPQSETASAPLVQSTLPVAVELPEVRMYQAAR